jgi:hypothetical protein
MELRSVELIELLENLKGYYGPTIRIYLHSTTTYSPLPPLQLKAQL